MSAYNELLGHDRVIARLERARRLGRVAHGYLFYGPDGVGKEKVALTLAQALNCSAEADAPCGLCESCRKITHHNHPDVRTVACEAERVARGWQEPEKGKNPSDQIRNADLTELANLFQHRPYLGRFKVVLIVDADKMNEHCQNRFLKTLEEPSADSVIVLISARPDSLLSTIRSRCQALRFGPIPRQEVARWLMARHELPEERALVLAGMAQGSLGKADQLARGDFLTARDQVIAGLSRIQQGDLADLLEVAETLGGNKVELQETLELMEIWLRDLLLAGLGVQAGLWFNQDRTDLVVEQAGRFRAGDLVRSLRFIQRTREDLQVNANPKMALQAMCLNMRND